MTSGFEKPITIKDIINKIDKRECLLPALQRQFVWGAGQIEILFDSIMREYPINSFMFWHVTEPSIKNNLKFYEFLKMYRQKYNELNPEFVTIGYTDCLAVIDGQQRLTGIYIGLKGSFAYKEYKKWWRDDEECLPTRFLYLDLNSEMPEDNAEKIKYDFRFLADYDIEWFKKNEPIRNWYKVGDILTIENRSDLDNLNNIAFPFNDIVTEFAADPSKNLTFDDAFIDELLKTQYESGEAYLILSLLYPQLDYFNQDTHKDHLHNAEFFRKINYNLSLIPASDLDFYKDWNNWNSILNLQMLNSSLNNSKNDKLLKIWVAQNNIDLSSHIIPQGINLDISNFKQFIEERKKLLIVKIKALI